MQAFVTCSVERIRLLQVGGLGAPPTTWGKREGREASACPGADSFRPRTAYARRSVVAVTGAKSPVYIQGVAQPRSVPLVYACGVSADAD